ncbi:hypothetical protein BpHYR1_024148 [Brachionus plicatilis]|uniref:Uncharacterized protein n=1 Tax=Brachionus plicatilis TaxID=10195 RepID=A0A3M7R9T7_BRAPC|nr:hypothetical protein BpHYR1_024148 [Brachionus plicatilis]
MDRFSCSLAESSWKHSIKSPSIKFLFSSILLSDSKFLHLAYSIRPAHWRQLAKQHDRATYRTSQHAILYMLIHDQFIRLLLHAQQTVPEHVYLLANMHTTMNCFLFLKILSMKYFSDLYKSQEKKVLTSRKQVKHKFFNTTIIAPNHSQTLISNFCTIQLLNLEFTKTSKHFKCRFFRHLKIRKENYRNAFLSFDIFNKICSLIFSKKCKLFKFSSVKATWSNIQSSINFQYTVKKVQQSMLNYVACDYVVETITHHKIVIINYFDTTEPNGRKVLGN